MVLQQLNRSRGRKTWCFDVVACTILLLPFVLFSAAVADSEVAGNVVGHWLLENSPVHVLSDIEIPRGENLSIEPGVVVLFEGNYLFTIRGRLDAVGGDSSHQRIVFTRPDSTCWRGIRFTSESHIRSAMMFCNLINPWIGVSCESCAPLINSNFIKALSKGIELDAASPNISYNYLVVGGYNTNLNPTGIWMINGAIPRISNNKIELSTGTGGEIHGIWISGSQPTIDSNWVDIKSDGTAYGIFTDGHVTKLIIHHNIIRINSPTEMIGIRLSNSTGVRIFNNDIHLIGTSSAGTGMFFDDGCSVFLFSNIIFGNGSSNGMDTEDDVVDLESGYNDFWNHRNNFAGYWDGSHTDISANPRWLNARLESTERSDYNLQWIAYPIREGKSPCIDGGMPGPRDYDGTIPDMGAIYFHQYPVEVVEASGEFMPSDFLMKTYPNPFNSQLTLELIHPREAVSIQVYDLSGRLLETIWNGTLNDAGRLNWQPGTIPAGEYLLQVRGDQFTQTKRVVFLP